MDFLKKWKIGRVRIYVTTYRMKRRGSYDDRHKKGKKQ